MKIQNFIKILDQSDNKVTAFFKKNGRNIFTNNQFLQALMQEKWSKKKRRKLVTLSWVIFFIDEICAPCNKKRSFEILPIYKYFQQYMYGGCAFFGDKRIPWEEWKDLAKEQVDLLQTLVEENKLEKFEDDKRYHDFCDKYDLLEEKLFNKGYYQLRDGEYT